MNHKLRVYIFPLSLALHVQHINSHNGFWRRIQLDGDEKCKMDFKNPPIHDTCTYRMMMVVARKKLNLKKNIEQYSMTKNPLAVV